MKLIPGMRIRDLNTDTVWEVLPYEQWGTSGHWIDYATAQVVQEGTSYIYGPVGFRAYFTVEWESYPGEHFVLDHDEFELWVLETRHEHSRDGMR